VYVALLKTHHQDTRDLVRHGLDIIVPALPRRLPSAEFIKVGDDDDDDDWGGGDG
jgi:hypothetical protein